MDDVKACGDGGSSYKELYCGWGTFLPAEVEHVGCSEMIMHAGCSFSGLVVQVTVVWWRAQKPLQAVTPQSDNLQLLLLNRIVKRIQNPKQHVGNGSLLPVMSWLI